MPRQLCYPYCEQINKNKSETFKCTSIISYINMGSTLINPVLFIYWFSLKWLSVLCSAFCHPFAPGKFKPHLWRVSYRYFGFFPSFRRLVLLGALVHFVIKSTSIKVAVTQWFVCADAIIYVTSAIPFRTEMLTEQIKAHVVFGSNVCLCRHFPHSWWMIFGKDALTN